LASTNTRKHLAFQPAMANLLWVLVSISTLCRVSVAAAGSKKQPLLRREGEVTKPRAQNFKHILARLIQAKAKRIQRERSQQEPDFKICSKLADRRFTFEDPLCEKAASYGFRELQAAFLTERNYWSSEGNTRPYYAANTHMPQTQLNKLSPTKQMHFYTSGAQDAHSQMKLMLSAIFQNGYKDRMHLERMSVLDLGCGLGQVSSGLVKLGFGKVYCVDQAHSMLEAAKANLRHMAGVGTVVRDIMQRVEFVQSQPDLVCLLNESSMDLVYSQMTLQHMKPMLQVAYIEQMCDVLRSGGNGYIQVPVSLKEGMTGAEDHCRLDNEKAGMWMHYVPEKEVTRHLEIRGCKVLASIPSSKIGRAGQDRAYVFRKVT